MDLVIRTLFHTILTALMLWLAFLVISFLIGFSYTNHWSSWIPYILLGGWAPGKWYDLNLIHVTILLMSSYGLSGVLDFIAYSKISRNISLILFAVYFLFGGIVNFFYHTGENLEFLFKQFGLMHFCFFFGILFRSFYVDEELYERAK